MSEVKPKKKTGRPADYKTGHPTDYKEEYCEMLEKHLASGLSFMSFGGVVGVCIDTLHEWKNKHKSFSDSKNRGTTACNLFWEKMGRSGAAGRITGFNPAAWIFNMKNRFGWRDKQEIEHTGEFAKIHIVLSKDDQEL